MKALARVATGMADRDARDRASMAQTLDRFVTAAERTAP